MNFTIQQGQADQRIDNFLFKSVKGVPKSCLYRLLRKGAIRVNRKRIKSDYRIQERDQITGPSLRTSEITKVKPGSRVQQLLEEAIIYEDDSILVINKPCGIASHGGSGHDFGAIEILRHSRGPEQMLELVHRLDKETSGCLLFAKNREILLSLQEAFKQNRVEKRYLLLVHGLWPKDRVQVDFPLLKNAQLSGEYLTKVSEEGKSALTAFTVKQHFTHWTLLEARPFTGRTHQIRIHASGSGCPIAGDKKYGNAACRQAKEILGLSRLFLHAQSLTINLDNNREALYFEASIDHKLDALLKNLAEQAGR
jgi:23S rRNA pseudouridine955/2504/2580 synthase